MKFLDKKILKNSPDADKEKFPGADSSYLSWRETLSYGLGRGAQGMSTSMMGNTYVNYFLTNILGINSVLAGNIRLWAGLWDAINDPVLGIIVDKTNTKNGKMRPYIRWAPYLVALTTIFFFTGSLLVADYSNTAKIIFAIIFFVGWDMAYTAVDIPMGALAFSITPNGVERTKLFGYSSIIRAILGAIPAGFVTLAVIFPYFKENTDKAYIIASIASGAGMILLTRFTYKNTRERAQHSEDTPSVRECFSLLFQNRPLFMLFLSNMAFLLVTTSAAVSMYFAIDLMGSSKYVLLLTIATAPGTFLAGLIVPKVVEKLGRKADFKKLYIGCCLAAAALHLLFFAVCKAPLLNKTPGAAVSIAWALVIMAFVLLSHLPLEFKNLLGKEMEAETVDYIEWKTGVRAEGIMLSLMSFTGKLTNSFSSAIALFILGLTHYQPHGDAIAVVQNPETEFALFAMYTLIPMAGYLLMLIPMAFYNITGEKHHQMQLEIAERKKGNIDE